MQRLGAATDPKVRKILDTTRWPSPHGIRWGGRNLCGVLAGRVRSDMSLIALTPSACPRGQRSADVEAELSIGPFMRSCAYTRRFGLAEGGAVGPHAVQDDRELAGDRHLGAPHVAALGDAQTPGLQGRPGTAAAKQRVGGLLRRASAA